MNFNPEHVDRVCAGLVEPWKQSEGADPSIKHFHEGNLHCRWNSSQTNWINVDDEDAEEQIGSVFAVQGIDLNKVGVLIGPDVKVENGVLKVDYDHFLNDNSRYSKEEMEIAENRKEFNLLVLNNYYVLLTRGIDGIRLGFWKNDTFQDYMEEALDIK